MGRLQSWFGNGWFGIAELLLTALCVFFSLSIHEFAHGYAAYKMGDNTAKYMGRLNINPMSHLDPIGALCLFLFGFGWARPVPVNPGNFKTGKIKSGMVITSLAGPLSNLVVAFLSLLVLRLTERFYGFQSEIAVTVYNVIVTLLVTLISMNISLAIFNLIPIPPLDGSKILSAILPSRIYFKLMQFERYGFIILIILINLPVFSRILYWLRNIFLIIFDGIIGILPFL